MGLRGMYMNTFISVDKCWRKSDLKGFLVPANFINFNLLRQALLTCLGFDQQQPNPKKPKPKSQTNQNCSTICCLCLSSGVLSPESFVLIPSSRERLSHLQSTVPYLSLMTFVSLAHTHTCPCLVIYLDISPTHRRRYTH